MTTTTYNDPPMASREYRICQETVKKLMETVKARLAKHAEQQARQPRNWGWAGDLTEVTRQLTDLAEFLNQ